MKDENTNETPKMTSGEWQGIYTSLRGIRDQFNSQYPFSIKERRGKNEKIRKAAEREMEICISTANYLIRSNLELYKLFISDSTDPIAITEKLSDLRLSRFFDSDIQELLEKIQNKINSL